MNRNIAIIDYESTGTNVSVDRIVQIALLVVNPQLEIVQPLVSQMVNPTIPIHPKATEVHGITDEMVANQPTFAQIAPSFRNAIKDFDLAFYNGIKFDLPLMIEEFARAGMTFQYEDKRLLDSFIVFSKKERRDLTAALKFYANKEMVNAHDAGADVMATLDIMRGQMAMYEDLQSLDDFHAIAEPEKRCDLAGKFRMEDGVVVYNFGKHFNTPVKDQLSFLTWMMDKDFSIDTKNYAIKLLEEFKK